MYVYMYVLGGVCVICIHLFVFSLDGHCKFFELWSVYSAQFIKKLMMIKYLFFIIDGHRIFAYYEVRTVRSSWVEFMTVKPR